MKEQPIDSLNSQTIVFDTMVDASDLLGLNTKLESSSHIMTQTNESIGYMFIDNPVYKGGMVLLLLAFFYVIYLYKEQLEVLAKIVTRKNYLENLYKERSNLLKQFTLRSSFVGALLLCLIAIRFAARYIETPISEHVSYELLPIIALVLTILVYIYRKIVIKLIAFVGKQSSFFKEHNYICEIYWTIGIVIISPLFLFGGSFQSHSGDLMLNLVGAMMVLTAFVYLYNSYLFFIRQKVSKLQWILYLCAVDLFPISLIAALGTT